MNGTDFLALVIDSLKGPTKKEKIILIKYINKLSDIAVKSRNDAENITGQLFCISWNEIKRAACEAESVMDECGRKGISVVSFYNSDYPPLLREIYSPPSVLYVKGMLPDSSRPSVSIVGTRNASRRTLIAAYDTAYYLAEKGINVISGLARGIDSKAHEGAVDGRGITAAVLGCGPDLVYPAENRVLAERILLGNGALISEYRPGKQPEKYHFPERNRIISGISRGTVIVHAPEKSGSLITASFALDQGRDVFVHSGGLYSSSGIGGLQLCENGAIKIESGEDILNEWNMKTEKRENEIKYRFNENIYNVKENNFSALKIKNNGLYYRREMYA